VTARILNVSDQAYHSDPCESPSLSHSIAHILLTENARHAWLAHPRLGGVQRASTSAMEDGSILHRLLLGAGREFELVMENDWRTKAAKEARAAVIESGKIPVLAHKFEALFEAAKRIAQNAADQGYPLGIPGSESEVAIEFTEIVDGKEVLCRCRLDQMRPDLIVYDIKKVASVKPSEIARNMVDNGYHLQHHVYTRAVEMLKGDDAVGRVDFVFICCEIEEPYEVVPGRLSGIDREIGKRDWEQALRRWHQLLSSNTYPWPGYSDGAVVFESPPYVISKKLPEEYA
jgi:hypothetical protein